MSAKSNRHRKNRETESRLLDDSEIEQRALQIARQEGRGLITAEDRARAREELLAPNEVSDEPEVSPELGSKEVTTWDEAPGSSGKQVPKVKLEDEASIGKDLIEKGLRGPR
jgi:hypothetical protein